MELLPESVRQFRDPKYWNQFFQQRGQKTFEWYGGFSDIEQLLRYYLDDALAGTNTKYPEELRILNLGNGNSTLPIEIIEKLKFPRITNVDFSDTALEEMVVKYPKSKFPLMDWSKCDVRNRGLLKSFEKGSFDVVLDKAFLDAYLAIGDNNEDNITCEKHTKVNGRKDSTKDETCDCYGNNNTDGKEHQFNLTEEARNLFDSIIDILSPGGSYILISLLQSYIVKELTRHLLYSSNKPSSVCSVLVCPFRTLDGAKGDFSPHPYFVVIKKAKENMIIPKIPCTICPHSSQDIIDISQETFAIFQLPRKIKEISNTRQLGCFVTSWKPGQSHEIHLLSDISNQSTSHYNLPKYTVTLYDNKNPLPGAIPTVATLIPFGQETDWLFQAVEGYQILAEGCNAKRLLLITVAFGFQQHTSQHTLNSIESSKQLFQEISEEISPYLKHLSLNAEKAIPVMTIAEHFGQRIEIASKDSAYAGVIFVYDYSIINSKQPQKIKKKNREIDIRRRVMSFACNPRLIQSEIKVQIKSNETYFHFDQICSDYYQSVIASFALLSPRHLESLKTRTLSCLVLGLGGGILVNLLILLVRPIVASLAVISIELDPAVVDIARAYFGYPKVDSRNENGLSLKTITQDALQYVNGLQCNSQDVLIVDINSADRESAVLCPPQAFVEPKFLKRANEVLTPGGILVFNVVTRSEIAHASICSTIKNEFGHSSCYEFGSEQDLNRVVICRKSDTESDTMFSNQLLLRNLEIMAFGHKSSHWVPNVDNKDWSDRLKAL